MRYLVFAIWLFIASPVSAAILFYDNCEDGPSTSEWILYGADPQDQPNSILTASPEQARAGSKSYKVVLPAWPLDGTGSYDKRTEMMPIKVTNPPIRRFNYNTVYWIGFSMYYPPNAINPDTTGWCLFSQFHATSTDTVNGVVCDTAETNPSCTLYFDSPGDILTNIVIGVDDECTVPLTYTRREPYPNLPIRRGWNDIVYQVKFDYRPTNNPFQKVWINGVLVVNDVGINCWNDDVGPFYKIGLYGIKSSPLTIYLDEIRFGDSNSSYAEVVPGGTSIPTALEITTTSLGTFTQNSTTTGTLAATGGIPVYLWVTDAPAWFTLTENTGVWSATPTAAGTYAFQVGLYDDDLNYVFKTFSGTITETTAPTPPSVTAFDLPATSTTLEIPVNSFTGSTGTTGYVIVESPESPPQADSRWSATAQTTVTTSGTGAITFYGFVRNAAGQVSAASVETVTIAITNQVVTGWTETATTGVWSAALTTLTPLSVHLDGVYGTYKPLLLDVSQVGDWYFASNVLYLRSDTDPDTAYATITASTDAEPEVPTPPVDLSPVINTGGDKTIITGGSQTIEIRND